MPESTLSHASISRLRQYAERAHSRMKRFSEQNEERIGHAIEIVEVDGALFAAGYANRKFGNGELRVLGVPADLGLGALGILAGFTGSLGKYSEHGIHVGAGLAGAYLYRLGDSLATPAQSTGRSTFLPHRRSVMTSGSGRVEERVEMG